MPKREVYYYNPIDLDQDIAVGIKLKFGSNQSNVPFGQTAASSSISPNENSTFSIFESTYTTEEQAHSNLFSLLLTRKGERVMHPEFGIGIDTYLFEQKTDNLRETLVESMKAEINYWLPYIIIKDLEVDFDESEYLIKIKLTYKATSSGAERSIVLFVSDVDTNIME